ncbi:MAG: hypothetical protein IH795_06160 [Bacteroidetes bacterium]|nr:hypothetical protein [Bacteroidota bacterium]
MKKILNHNFHKKKKNSLQYLGYEPVVIGLNRDRTELYNRINTRVERMFKRGLVKEIERLSKQKFSTTASQAVGYKEVRAVLRQKPLSRKDYKLALAETRELIKRNTRRYAKRQLTWFKADQRIKWFNVSSQDDIDDLTLQLIKDID